jgi:hypothetical protein
MQTWVCRFVGAAAVLFLVSPAQAQKPNPYSGYAQLPACKNLVAPNLKDSPDQQYCAGQLRALAYVSHVLRSDLRSCVPNDLPNGQLAVVAIHFIEAHPGPMNEDFLMLAIMAFREAWPCK